MRFYNSIAFALLVFAQPWLASVFGQGRVDQIVASGDASPDGNGTFATTGSRVTATGLNDSGQVLILSSLIGTSGGQTDDIGVFLSDGETITQIVREGQSRPGGGVYVDSFSAFLNSSGQVAFDNKGFGNSANAAIFIASGGTITHVAAEGQLFPGTGEAYNNVFPSGFNDAGQVMFQARTPGTNQENYTGILLGSGGAHNLIVSDRQNAPDGNGSFAFVQGPVLNSSNRVLFSGILRDTSGGGADDFGYFHGSGGALTTVFREGNSAPDGNGTFSSPSGIDFNDSNQTAFSATLSGTMGGSSDNSGIYLHQNSATTQILDEGIPSPDSNGVFSASGSPYQVAGINNSGQIVFLGTLSGTAGGTDDDRGVFLTDLSGGISKVLREGDMVPDGNGSVSAVRFPELHDSGLVLVEAQLAGTAGGSVADEALFVGDGVDVVEVVREGDTLAGSTITSRFFSPHVNSMGQVVYSVDLADRSRVVNQWTPTLRWREMGGGSWEQNDSWTLGLEPSDVHDVVIDPETDLTIQGPDSQTTINSLQIGGGAGTATLNLRSNVMFTVNEGINIMPNGELSGVDIPTNINNTGKIQIGGNETTTFNADVEQNGDLQIAPSGRARVFGSFFGRGGFFGGGRLSIFGRLRPGNSPASVLFDGDLELDPSSITEIELGGLEVEEFDQLVVSGDFDVAGTLSLSLIDDHTLSMGERYLIGQVGGNRLGQFDGLDEGSSVGNFDGTDLFITYQGGDGNDIELYTKLVGDFDDDGDVDADDIDFYAARIGQSAVGQELFDLDDDNLITLADHDLFVTTMVQTSNGKFGTSVGDINLDGTVDVLGDAFTLVANLNGPGALGYESGDLNADRTVDVLGDAFRLVSNLGQNNDNGLTLRSIDAVPEPSSFALYVLWVMSVGFKRSRS